MFLIRSFDYSKFSATKVNYFMAIWKSRHWHLDIGIDIDISIQIKKLSVTQLNLPLELAIYAIHCVKSVSIRSFFWSVFSQIWTEYGEIRSISSYSVRMRENADQKKLRIWTLHTVILKCSSLEKLQPHDKRNSNNSLQKIFQNFKKNYLAELIP